MDYVIVIAAAVFILIILYLTYNYVATVQTATQLPPGIPSPAPAPDSPEMPLGPAPAPNNTPPAPPSPVTVTEPQYMGCFVDQSTRALSTMATGMLTVDQCAGIAKVYGSPYFGIQYANATGKGQCWYGNGQYDKYGTSSKCSLKDSNGRILGASWANAIYKTN